MPHLVDPTDQQSVTMQNRIVIVGAGFAGVWSALSAKRLTNLHDKQVEVLVTAPEPHLVMRPRLYEANPSTMTHSFGALFEAAGIKFVQGVVKAIRTEQHTIDIQSTSGVESSVPYTRLVLAAGSNVARPERVAGVQQHAFDVDSLDSAAKLESHLEHLASLPPSPARDNIVVCGAGFTGVELATELPRRLNLNSKFNIILVENADAIGPELGPGPRPSIMQALHDLNIQVKLGSAVTTIDAGGLTLASGERIETLTPIWTAGVRATPLTQQIPGAARDKLSRLIVDQDLRVPSDKHVFATGDTAHVLADTKGDHLALMSCQHALALGRVSGHNAAADLLGEPMVPYSQEAYLCCLDLGAWGAVVARGWEREVQIGGDAAKRVKAFINQKLIYPPLDVEQALAGADPANTEANELIERMIVAVV